jgi:hypothetical protein
MWEKNIAQEVCEFQSSKLQIHHLAKSSLSEPILGWWILFFFSNRVLPEGNSSGIEDSILNSYTLQWPQNSSVVPPRSCFDFSRFQGEWLRRWYVFEVWNFPNRGLVWNHWGAAFQKFWNFQKIGSFCRTFVEFFRSIFISQARCGWIGNSLHNP